MAELCDLCDARPATVRVRVPCNGETAVLNLREVDDRRLAAQPRSAWPLEPLFGSPGSFFDDFFGETGGFVGARAGGGRDKVSGVPPARGAARPMGEPQDRLSEHAKDLLQSAERAVRSLARRASLWRSQAPAQARSGPAHRDLVEETKESVPASNRPPGRARPVREIPEESPPPKSKGDMTWRRTCPPPSVSSKIPAGRRSACSSAR